MSARLVWPVVALALVGGAAVGVSRMTFRGAQEPDAEDYLASLIAREGKLTFPPFACCSGFFAQYFTSEMGRIRLLAPGPRRLSCTLFVEGTRGKTLLHPLLECKDENGKVHSLVSAEEGELHVEADKPTLRLRLLDGEISLLMERRRIPFAARTWSIPLPDNFARRGPQPALAQ